MATEGEREPEELATGGEELMTVEDEGDISQHQSAFLTPLNESLVEWEGDDEQEVQTTRRITII